MLNRGHGAAGLLLRSQIPQALFFPIGEAGSHMEPLGFRNRLQMKRTRRTSLTAGTTADAQVPVICRLRIGGLIKGVGENLAAPDALAAGMALLIILHDAIV